MGDHLPLEGGGRPAPAGREGVGAAPQIRHRCRMRHRRHPTPDCLRQSDPPPPGEGDHNAILRRDCGVLMKPVVLSLGVFPPATMSTLAELFELHHFTVYPLPEGTLSPDIKSRIRAIATEANRGASRELIASLPKLEIISCFGVGVDGIDLAAARERAIPVTNTPGVVVDECADLAIGMMLASARQIVHADHYGRSGEWLKGPIALGLSVGGKTAAVVGLGGIGRAIADRAQAFRMKVLL